MNKFLPALLLAALAPLTTPAVDIVIKTEGKIGDNPVTYTWALDLDPSDNSVTIEGISPKPALDYEVPATFLGSDGVTILVVKAIGDEAFAGCPGLTSVALPSTLLSIGDKAFADCTSLASVKISYGVRYIGERAFMNTIITELAVPDSLLDMGGNIGAGALFNGNISIGDSSHFCYSDDGVLYNKDMTRLYACPTRAEGTINIPSTVTNICTDAFFGCHRLSYLNIPSSVSVIGDGAFNVSGIWSELDAPEATPRLESVFYQGKAPRAADDIYFGAPEDLVNYVFSEDWPSTWKGRPVTIITETNPPVLSTTIDGITWKYRIVDGYAEIYNDGAVAVIPATTTGIEYIENPKEEGSRRELAVKIPKSINGYTVTKIGENALAGCQGITYLGIPDTVTQIADGAFAECSGLKAISSCNNVPFNCADGVIDLPNGLESLGTNVFSGTKLRSLIIPTTLGTIAGNPFIGIQYLSTVSVDDGNPSFTSIDNALYDKKATKLIGVPANGSEVSVSIARTAVEIGDQAFSGCANLESVHMPDTIQAIGSEAFSGCSSIRDFAVPASVTTIGAKAFSNCGNLKKVSFAGNAPMSTYDIYDGSPNVVSYVNEGTTGWPTSDWCEHPIVIVSAGSAGGDELSFNDGSVTWHFRILGDVAEIYLDGGMTAVESEKPITSLTLPDTLGGHLVKGIGEGSLANLRGITSITIPLGYEWIGNGAFTNCTSLTSISFPKTLRTIHQSLFVGTAITTLTLPDSVTEIDGNPVAGCSSMTAVSVASGNPKFKSVDGVLYNRKGTCLVAVPACIDPDGCDFEIPAGVTEIGDEAFAGCETVENITVPATVETLGDRVFADNPGLRLVKFLGDVPSAGADIYEGSEAAITCYTEKTGGWPTDGVWMDRPLVSDSESAWSYTVADGAVTVTGLLGGSGDVTIPATLRGLPVTAIDPKAFNGTPGITSFSVDPANTAFSAKNGVLYSKDGKTLVRVPDTYLLDGTKTETVSEAKLSVTIVPAVAPDGTDGTTYTTNSTMSAPVVTTTTGSVKGTVPSQTLLNGVAKISDYAFYGCCNSCSNTTVSSTNQENGVTGFIGDDVYVKTISTVRSVKTVYDFSLPVGDDVVCGPRAFYGSPVTRAASGREPSGTGGGSGDQAPSGKDPLADLEAKSDYSGYLLKDGLLTGSVTVKTGAISRGKMKVTAKRQLLGGKKQTIKDLAQFVPAGCTLVLAKTDKKTKAFDGYKGKVWTIALGTIANGGSELLNGYSALSVSVAAKGKAKLTGYLGDGTRVSVSAQMMTVDGRVKIPFFVPLYSGKKGGFSMLLDVTDGLEVEALSDLTAIISRQTFTAVLIEVATGVPAASFSATVSFADSEIPEDYTIDPSVGNWKLRYTAKTGLVKGSLKAVKGNRKVTVPVNGVVVDGTAWCSGLIKKVASLALCAE